jgi:hypothetical protein
MSDERPEEGGEALQRSASAMIFQGAEAFGAAATGLGALAAGAAQWKDKLGGGNQTAGETPPPNDPPSDQKPT